VTRTLEENDPTKITFAFTTLENLATWHLRLMRLIKYHSESISHLGPSGLKPREYNGHEDTNNHLLKVKWHGPEDTIS
jgi:hypothetical protein